jgi:hypothetical protein
LFSDLLRLLLLSLPRLNSLAFGLLFFHFGPPASWLADELLPDLDLLDIVFPVLLVLLDPVEPVVERPRLSSIVASTGWLQAQLEPGQLSVVESSPG